MFVEIVDILVIRFKVSILSWLGFSFGCDLFFDYVRDLY